MSKKTILIIDDSFTNRETLTDILQEEYAVLEAENGQEAVELLERGNVVPDLILLDMVMPVMDGFGFLAVMNKRKWIDTIPVVIISPENSTEVIDRAYDLGASDYIEHPFDSKIVNKRVRSMILLYAKQNRLFEMVSDQIYERLKGLADQVRACNEKLYIDSLTGVYNRRYYDEQVEMQENGDGIAMIDIDNFKNMNDTHGHLAGDEYLRKVAQAILVCVRSTDAVIRYGGDEFLLVLRQISGKAFREKLERIRLAVAAVKVSRDLEFTASISIGGVCRYGKVTEKIREADEMLYRAKDKKNRVAVYGEDE